MALPLRRSVRPQEPIRRASAVSILPGRRIETRSLACPGVCRNLRGSEPRCSRSPSSIRISTAPEGASSCMTSFAIVLDLRSRAPETWSAWVWLSITYATLRPCLTDEVDHGLDHLQLGIYYRS